MVMPICVAKHTCSPTLLSTHTHHPLPLEATGPFPTLKQQSLLLLNYLSAEQADTWRLLVSDTLNPSLPHEGPRREERGNKRMGWGGLKRRGLADLHRERAMGRLNVEGGRKTEKEPMTDTEKEKLTGIDWQRERQARRKSDKERETERQIDKEARQGDEKKRRKSRHAGVGNSWRPGHC